MILICAAWVILTSRGIKKRERKEQGREKGMASGFAPSLIDHTLLRPQATVAEIDRLCQEAVENGFWSVCILPVWVPRVKSYLAGTGVRVCTVVGFPLGGNTGMVKAAEAAEALAQGADEIDMALNIGALKSGDVALVRREIEGVSRMLRLAGAERCLKVITETCYLTAEEKVLAARLAEEGGAHFVKTSTGFGSGGATVEDVVLLREVLKPSTRIKASGGIRTLEQAEALLAAGADRLGTSAGVALVQEWKRKHGLL